MPDLEKWTIQVDSSGLEQADRRFKSSSLSAAQAERAADRLEAGFKRLSRATDALAEASAREEKATIAEAVAFARANGEMTKEYVKAVAKREQAQKQLQKAERRVADEKEQAAKQEKRIYAEIQRTEIAAAARADAVRHRDLASLKSFLRTEEQAIRDSYAKRRAVAYQAPAGEQKALLARLASKERAELAALRPTVRGLGSDIKNLVAVYVSFAAVRSLGSTFVTVNREFDKLEAGLQTVTGSAKDAGKVMAELTKIGADTPFSVREVTDAWTMMVNRGLSPTKREFMALGNIAATTKFGIIDIVEAVANAMANQTENLKKYGIQAITQGDKISFTFQGVTTTVKKNAKEIQGYFTQLGENNFAGAMANRMKTLDGAISNLGDAWEQLWRTIGKTDVGGMMKDAVDSAKDAFEGLTKFLQSDEMSRAVLAVRKMGIDLAYVVDKAGGIKQTLFALTPVGAAWKGAKYAYQSLEDVWTGEDLMRQARKKPEDIPGTPEWTRKQAQADLDREYISNRIIAETSGGKTNLGKYGKTGDGARAKTEAELARAKAAREKRLKELREYEQGMALINAAISGRVPRQEEEYEPSGVGYREYLDLETERERLRRETDARILSASSAPDEMRQELIDAIYKDEKQKLEAILAAENEKRDALMDGLRTEEEDLRLSYDRRLKTIQDAVKQGVIFEEEGMDITRKLREKQAEEERMRNLALIQNSAAAGEALFGNLAEAAKNAGGVQSEAYKRLFALSQTFAIASATTSMFTGIAKGLEAGWPTGIPLMIGAAAEGAGIIAKISAMKYSGAYDAGGFIPAGKFGLVGERRPELIQGPANVVGGAQTAQMLGGRPNIAVYVAPDADQATKFARSAPNEQAFLVFAQKNKTALRRILGS